jgi:hydroxypyruvate reductase
MIDNRAALNTSPRHDVALSCIEAGIRRALPARIVAETVSLDGETLAVDGTTYTLGQVDDIVVVGGGKAAGGLAAALEDVLGDRIRTGVVVTDDPSETERIDQVEGAHPVPDDRGQQGARRVIETARAADESTLVIALVTGGGSALLPAPAGDVPLEDLQTVTDELVRSGAPIEEINAVRKHLSALKGGRLAAAAAPATVVGLVVSDVVGNRLDVVASGPISPDESTFGDAERALAEAGVEPPSSVRIRLDAGVAGEIPETPTGDHQAFERVSTHVLADGLTALEAAADAAADHGYEPLVLSSRIRGEASEAALTHVGIAGEIAATGTPVDPPAVVLSGGETTVTVSGSGTGGPNQEFALGGAIDLSTERTCLAAVDTDGIDGPTDAAGAVVTAADGEPTGEAREALRANDAFPFLAERDALVRTGPTGTNVNDLRVMVIDG